MFYNCLFAYVKKKHYLCTLNRDNIIKTQYNNEEH